jgi:hypothetical protein
MRTSNGTDLGKTPYIKTVDDFDAFPASIYTSSSDKWYRSNDLWKSGGAAGISSFLDRSAKLIHFGVWAFIPAETEETQNTKVVGDFTTFMRRGIAPNFDVRRRNSKSWKLERKTDDLNKFLSLKIATCQLTFLT